MFSWLLILPLAIPTYIMAYAYAGLVDYAGPLQSFGRSAFGAGNFFQIDIMNLPGAIFVMSLVLYPYVYLLAKASFSNQSASLIEASRILGKGQFATFWKIALPASRPAAIAGVTLVVLEVLNDYGAVYYFGVPTLTTGIFRAWFSLGEVNTAIYLAALLLLLVAVVLIFEKASRGQRRFSTEGKPVARVKLSGASKNIVTLLVGLVVGLALALPTFQIAIWVSQTYFKVLDVQFYLLAFNSVLLAFGASLTCCLIGVVILFAYRRQRNKTMAVVSQLASIGYAIPGAIIAIGVFVPMLSWDRSIRDLVRTTTESDIGLLLTGTLVALVFAYTVRFLAVAFNPIDAGFARIPESHDDAASSLGAKPSRLLMKISLPLLRGPLLAAILLVFVDVMKELPLTLILRPFNFHTLATKTFEYASDELVAHSANSSFIIIAIGILPVLMLDRLMDNRRLRAT